jgi:hypothetical protein
MALTKVQKITNGECAVDERRKLLEEAAACRELAREIKDPASITMFLERAEQLELRAAAITDALRTPEPCAVDGAVAGPETGSYDPRLQRQQTEPLPAPPVQGAGTK